MNLLLGITLFLISCGQPTAPDDEDITADISTGTTIEGSLYRVNYLMQALKADSNWETWYGVVVGRLEYLGEDTLKDAAMEFILTLGIDRVVVSRNIGFFTFDTVSLLFFGGNFPYAREIDLIPGELYQFYAISERLIYNPSLIAGWITPLIENYDVGE